MIARLMLSLKKASDRQEGIWSFGEPSMDINIRFAGGRRLGTTGDEIGLDTFGGRRERTRSEW
jgi:hypothetical protein